jgi:hypothetical protein
LPAILAREIREGEGRRGSRNQTDTFPQVEEGECMLQRTQGPRAAGLLVGLVCLLFLTRTGACFEDEREAKDGTACCHVDAPGIVWYGSEPRITFQDLARYCGPILWFSPDEPLLDGKKGAEIRVPEPVPFEEPVDAPIVYYRVRELLLGGKALDASHELTREEKGGSVLHLDRIGGIKFDYFFYYSTEEGVGRHAHDVESAELLLRVIHNPMCPGCEYAISVERVTAKAHGLLWYDNTLDIDKDVSFPITLLVEEGKHATCTDKNGDGYYSPGYDVNRRINDAWGVRDVIRTGALFTAGYQAWMTKVRGPGTIVVPPLPEDSPLYDEFARDDRGLKEKAAYSLRPFPEASPARDDPKLFSLIEDKGYPEWPVEKPDTDFKKISDIFTAESFTKSVGVAYRYDGLSGVSVVFPLLIVKNVEEPLTGGWMVNRVYTRFKPGAEPNDYAWNMLYTPSASRWMDPYFSAGLEIENSEVQGRTDTTAHFAFETGVKARGNLAHTPARFLTFLTDF